MCECADTPRQYSAPNAPRDQSPSAPGTPYGEDLAVIHDERYRQIAEAAAASVLALIAPFDRGTVVAREQLAALRQTEAARSLPGAGSTALAARMTQSAAAIAAGPQRWIPWTR